MDREATSRDPAAPPSGDRSSLRAGTGGAGQWLRRGALALALGVPTLASPALAHAGGHESGGGNSHEVAVLLLALGGALVVAGLALARYRDLPRQYVDGLVVGGAAIVLLLAPLFWFF